MEDNKKELVKTQLQGIKCYGVSYNEMKEVLDVLIQNEQKLKISKKYTISLEGDYVFDGLFSEVENYIKSNLVKKRWSTLKNYEILTPTNENVILVYSDEFGGLFKWVLRTHLWDEIEKGDKVYHLAVEDGKLVSDRIKTVKVVLYGVWDGEKVQFDDKDKTVVRTTRWLHKVGRTLRKSTIKELKDYYSNLITNHEERFVSYKEYLAKLF